MFRIWNAHRTKLTWYLIGCVFLSVAVAFGCGYLVITLGLGFMETWFEDLEANRTFQERYIEDLQDYVTENQITADNIFRVREWSDENVYVYFSIYQNNKVIFNSDYMYDESISEVEIEPAETVTSYMNEQYRYRLDLVDGTVVSVDMFCYDYWQYYYYVWIIGVALGILIFISMLVRLLKKKLGYINEIEKELQILEGGNLEYPITIKGQDELGNLARGIEQMRLSIIENRKKEQKMQQANKDLITSMSHDLRTPLTTLTGYLEILNLKQIRDEGQRQHYLEQSLAKTREIKELSDELFEYFLIYGEHDKQLTVEAFPAYALVEDLIGNQFLYLEEEGYQVTSINQLDQTSGNCLINPQYMQRVLNNILSNLEKYADKRQPIEVSARREKKYLMIQVRNGIRKNRDIHESTKIGLITCERIMRLHHGVFQKYEMENEFMVKLLIPME